MWKGIHSWEGISRVERNYSQSKRNKLRPRLCNYQEFELQAFQISSFLSHTWKRTFSGETSCTSIVECCRRRRGSRWVGLEKGWWSRLEWGQQSLVCCSATIQGTDTSWCCERIIIFSRRSSCLLFQFQMLHRFMMCGYNVKRLLKNVETERWENLPQPFERFNTMQQLEFERMIRKENGKFREGEKHFRYMHEKFVSFPKSLLT